jgi:hypothetical protein
VGALDLGDVGARPLGHLTNDVAACGGVGRADGCPDGQVLPGGRRLPRHVVSIRSGRWFMTRVDRRAA